MDAQTEKSSSGTVLSARDLQRFCAGDVQVLDVLVAQFQHVALFVARSYVKDEHATCDVVQDAFVRAFERRAQFDAQRAFQPWLLTIVRNLCLDHLRRQRGHAALDDVTPPSFVPQLMENLNRDEQGQRIASIMQAIPEPYREHLLLRDVQGLSPQDIAEVLGADYNTTRWRIHKARTLFRELWVERFGAWEP
jgi:RNA polymerase sigma factor (sigma-70 family)